MGRCEWAGKDPLYLDYHDKEWGVAVYDDDKLFEFLILETFQAGLSWITVLRKRENFRKAFDNFNYKKIATYQEEKYESLMQDAGIIRNQLKIRATISNAQAFIKVQEEFGSFDEYLWGFVRNKPIKNKFKKLSDLPTSTEISVKLSQDLKKHGFNFVGPTICYALMQAIGMVNDHTSQCFLYQR